MEVQLRVWREEDAELLYALANNKNIADNLRDIFPYPYAPEDAVAYIKSCLEADASKQTTCAITADGSLAGSIGIFYGADVHRRSGELGYWLAESYWGCGIMTKAVKMFCRAVFASTELVRIYAEPFSTNIASCKVLEKSGFVLEGIMRKNVFKNNHFLDSHIYALLKE